MTTAMEDTNVQINTDLLGQRVLLLSPTMSVWRGQFQLPKKAEIHMDDRILDSESVTNPRVKLMTKKTPVDSDGKPWKSRFDACTSRLSALKNQFSVSFAINGVRIIPKTAASAFMHKLFGPTIGTLKRAAEEAEDNNDLATMHALRDRIYDTRMAWGDIPTSDKTPVYDPAAEQQSIAYEFWNTALEFVRDYNVVMDQMRSHPCWELVSTRVPRNSQAMLQKFDIGVFPIELSGTTTNELTLDELAAHADVVRETCARQVQLAIESMIAEPRKELAETLQNVEDLISTQGRITSRTFDRVRRAMDKLQNFSFVTDAALMQRMQQLNTMLADTIPSRLNNVSPDTARATTNFSAELARIRQDLLDPVVMEADLASFSGGRRAIMLDDDAEE